MRPFLSIVILKRGIFVVQAEKYIMYLRKSRADSENETVEEVLQRHETILQEYAVKNFGKVIPAQNIYREVVSGETIEDRPEIKKVLSLIANGSYEGVLVVEPQRLSRGDMLDCGTIIRVLQHNDTKIVTPTKTFDLSEKYDRKFLEMDLQQGNDYLEYVKHILNRGRIASVKEGNYIGQTPPFGYDKCIQDKHHTLTPNQDADIIRLMFDLYVNKDMGCSQIASELDRRGIKPQNNDYWSAASIREMLRNPVYIGKIRWNNKKTQKTTDECGNISTKRIRNSPDIMIVDGLHPAIIDEELFRKAQAKTGKNSRKPGKYACRNPFATLVKCGTCGHAMSFHHYKNRNGELCSNPRLLCSHQSHCHTPSIDYYEFEKAVVSALKIHLEDYEIKLGNDNGNSAKLQENILKGLRKDLINLETQQNKLYELLERGLYTDEVFIQRNKALAQRRQELKAAIETQEQEIPKTIDYQEKIHKLSQAIEAIENQNISAGEKNTLLKSFIRRIEYYADNNQKGNRWKTTDFELEIFFI